MNQESDSEILNLCKTMLADRGMMSPVEFEFLVENGLCSRIASDGSTRRFWRLGREDKRVCVIAAPAGRSKEELAESRSAWKIGIHLRNKGVPVPELYGWDSTTGVLLFEDLGDIRLHDIVKREEKEPGQHTGSSVFEHYRAALEQLAAMQCKGAEGFAETWCWDSPRYDIQLMVEKESGYFLRAFWQGLMGCKVNEGVEDELLQIARLVSEAPPCFFLHRDFQSRNIMIKNGTVRFIDYQGGRLGPLGYDVASLLIDPYSSLNSTIQDELKDIYLVAVNRYLHIPTNTFENHYKLLAFQRNMQIVGAFSFLYKIRKKEFFIDFIKPALRSLHIMLEDPLFKDFPLIGSMVNRGLREVTAVC